MEAPVADQRDIELVTPFPDDWIPLLWTWARQDSHANFDDAADQSYEGFLRAFLSRSAGERRWGVTLRDTPVGAIAYLPLSPTEGMFHGICFTRSACGRGVARMAVIRVLDGLYRSGVDTVRAVFFNDNVRVRRFFEKMDATPAQPSGVFAVRGGVRTELSLMTLHPSTGRSGQSCR